MLQFLFLLCLGLLAYTYVGYGILLLLAVKIRNLFKQPPAIADFSDYTPPVTLVIRAYNEIANLPAKLQNCYSLDYPTDKIRFLFITQGSIDGSTEWMESLRDDGARQLDVQGGSKPISKPAAMNCAMQTVTSPIVIFSDVNTQLNKLAIRNLVRHFQDERVGVVAGEKYIDTDPDDPASEPENRLYRACESYLHQQNTRFPMVVGTVSDLLAIRTKLYKTIETDTLLTSFALSMRLVEKGHRIAYEPCSYTQQRPLYLIEEELKQAVDKSTARFQSAIRFLHLLNITRYGWLSFHYTSQWVLRWMVAPFCLPLILLINLALLFSAQSKPTQAPVWILFFAVQCIFYGLSYIGYRSKDKYRRINVAGLPFYFTFMSVCAIQGFICYWRNNPSGTWNKARHIDDVELQAS
ncbi:glycosyltransferase [Spirosoma sp.]|uniref:glycosyltransferase n=1 Tax=Spirosoma sp. TaxID=1899569 RepID=UPI0026174B8B|nr:glycosyltransferase [Spirosoma sp.]MCX6217447.1 glycosyltransferase [Spirosoma sp.]